MADIIAVDFSPAFIQVLNEFIHTHGVEYAETYMLSRGVNPSYVKCVIRRVLKLRGGKT